VIQAPDAGRVRECGLAGRARRVRLHREEARHAAAIEEAAAQEVTLRLRRHQHHVVTRGRLHRAEGDREAVREHQARAGTKRGCHVAREDLGLDFVGEQHHHNVGGRGRGCDLHRLEPVAARGFGAGAAAASADHHPRPGIAQIQRVGVALVPVAEHGHRGTAEPVPREIGRGEDLHAREFTPTGGGLTGRHRPGRFRVACASLVDHLVR
jgi:hypothetical protein